MLYNFLVVFYFGLVALETLLYFVHVVFVGVDELSLLAFEHAIHLAF